MYFILSMALFLSSCMNGVIDVKVLNDNIGGKSSGIISGQVLPLEPNPMAISAVEAFSCDITSVQVQLYKLDATGKKDGVSLATVSLDGDAKFSFAPKVITSLSNTVEYLIEASGCGSVYQRPLTNIDETQNLDEKTTIVVNLLNSGVSKKIVDVPREKVLSFTSQFENTTVSTMLEEITNNSEIQNALIDALGDSDFLPSLYLEKSDGLYRGGEVISFDYKIVDLSNKVTAADLMLTTDGINYSAYKSLSVSASGDFITLPSIDSNNAGIKIELSFGASSKKESQSFHFVIDDTDPIVSISLANNINLANVDLYSVSGTCSEEARSITLLISSQQVSTNCLNGVWSYSQGVASVSDGPVIISATQSDAAGNTATESIVVQKDATAPVLSIATANNSYINITNNTSFAINGTCSEDGTIIVSGDVNDSIICSSGLWSKNFDFQSLGDGNIALNFDINDAAGNSSITQNLILIKDTVAPLLTLNTPINLSAVNISNVAAISFSGTCSDSGTVVLSGDLSDTISCSGGNFSKIINLSSLSDGLKTINLDLSDTAGNNATQVNINLNKDVVAPGLTQTSLASNSHSNQDSVTFGGLCEDGITIDVSGEESTQVNCSSGSWSFSTAAKTSDGDYSFTFTQVDSVGNSSSISETWKRDTVLPSVSLVEISNSAEYVGSIFVIVKVAASDNNNSLQVKIENSNLTTLDCQGEYTDSNWQSYTGAFQSFSHAIHPGDGDKKVCVWAKDKAGNVTVIAPSAGTLGLDMDTVKYEVGNAPVVTAFSVTNNTAGPNFGTKTFNQGDQVLIEWTMTDIEGLDNSPVSLYYTDSASATATWNEIVVGHGAIGYGQTNYSDNYISFTAPTNGFFKVKLVASDSAGNTSIPADSGPLNTGNWLIYAGTNDRGIGGAARSVALKSKGRDYGFGDVALDVRTNDLYMIDNGNGLYKYDALSGKTSMFIKHGSNNLTDNSVLSTSSQVYTTLLNVRFDNSNSGLLYAMTSDAQYSSNVKIWQINVDTKEVKLYLGGGTVYDASATPSTAKVLNAPFNFDEDNTLYYFTHCSSSTTYDRYNDAPRLMKVTQNSGTKTAGAISFVAGDCTRANASSGPLDPLSSPIGAISIPSYGTLAAWDHGNVIYFCMYNVNCQKIINGQLYRTSIGSQRLNYIHSMNKFYLAGSVLYEITPNLSGDNGDILTPLSTTTADGECLADGLDPLMSCSRIVWPPIDGPNGTLGFMQGGDNSSYFFRYLDTSGKMQTYVGAMPFYGDGLDKSFMRGQISGIYYKKATEANQAAYPEGLYFVDRLSMVMGHIDPSTKQTSIIWGNQSGGSGSTEGEMISKNQSLGVTYDFGNLHPLTFDSQGNPWTRVNNSVYTTSTTKEIEIYMDAGSGYTEDAQTGDNPNATRIYPNGGKNNFAIKNKGLFYLSYYSSTSRTNIKSPELKYFDVTSATGTLHIMGDRFTNQTFSPDDMTGGNLASKTFHCAANNCYLYYDDINDKLYFSERTNLRVIDKPTTPAQSTLQTVASSSREIYNWIFSEDKSQIFYINSGSLYCIDISSGKSWCDDTPLGPSEGMETISSGANQLTWMNSTTLLISNYKGVIYQYNLLP
ncbi:hypothetical protein M899_2633 [Bacteriovorax sp. BSW11_IV]|nr:hypothetical protein M899_2633 [Bacteriovorax sp. BSW11_IV]